MSQNPISRAKQGVIGDLVLSKTLNIRRCARQLKISRNTVKRYVRLFKSFILLHPDCKASDLCEATLTKTAKINQSKITDVRKFLSSLLEKEGTSLQNIKSAWLSYLNIYPQGYSRSQFSLHFNNWKLEIKKIFHKSWQVQFIPQEDWKILKRWRTSPDRHKWELAVCIIESNKKTSTATIAAKVDRGTDKVMDWINIYKRQGLKGFEKKPRNVNQQIRDRIEEKKANLIRLIHEPPTLHGINRSSWFLKDLVFVYKESYNIDISTSTISTYLKTEGYVYRKAREVLTSPDPDFRTKMNKIKNILKNLGAKEKFFSIDEFGPFAVKIKGGRSLVKRGEIKTFPQFQKSKGFTICTAALELSSNQVTHIFSTKKNTEEIIKLIDELLMQYAGEDKLYLSWDAASWHASRKLHDYINKINQGHQQSHNSPMIELAPLPASSQFLNVIESVFSGLAKSIIHNSDYASLDECKAAISMYFKTRNEHFIANPHVAGNKIWGKELVAPIFDDSHNCKNPRFR